MSKLDEIIVDGISNHTGEFINPWLVKGNFTHEQLAVVLEGISVSKRLRGNIKILILDLLAESLKESDGDVGKLADKFTEKVKGL